MSQFTLVNEKEASLHLRVGDRSLAARAAQIARPSRGPRSEHCSRGLQCARGRQRCRPGRRDGTNSLHDLDPSGVLLSDLCASRSLSTANATSEHGASSGASASGRPGTEVDVSSHLCPRVSDTWAKRGAKLSTDRRLTVSWIHRRGRRLGRLGRPKRIARVCRERPAEPSVDAVFNSHLSKRSYR